MADYFFDFFDLPSSLPVGVARLDGRTWEVSMGGFAVERKISSIERDCATGDGCVFLGAMRIVRGSFVGGEVIDGGEDSDGPNIGGACRRGGT